MKSTFFYKLQPKHLHEQIIEADYVTFEPGYVVFHQEKQLEFATMKLRQPHRIIKAVHAEACHDLREILNE